MAQQNKDNSQPQGFAGFDDLISDLSEELADPLPKAKSVTPTPAAASASRAEPARKPPPSPARNDSPKPPPSQPQAPAKPEVRVIVEPKPVQSSLPQAVEQSSQKALWFFVICGGIIFLWIASRTNNQNQTFSGTSSNIKTPSTSVLTQATTSEPIRGPIMSSVIKTPQPTYRIPAIPESSPIATSKPSKPKIEPDPLVKDIQNKLLLLGYSPGSADGYIGQKTLNAVKQFQKENKLPVDLKMSEQLLSSLDGAQPRAVTQQHRQESSLNRGVKNDEKENVCPMGEICVHHPKEPTSSNSDNRIQNPEKPDVQQENSAINNYMDHMQRSYRILCPEGRICPPF